MFIEDYNVGEHLIMLFSDKIQSSGFRSNECKHDMFCICLNNASTMTNVWRLQIVVKDISAI
jgi:hypothetical protein